MDKFVQTTQDNGGVHINSGIPNKAFHNVAMELGGNAWEKAGGIWYSALRDPRVKRDGSLPDLREGDRPRGEPAIRRRERRGEEGGRRLEGGRDRDITRL